MTEEDLVQESYVVFLKLRLKYKEVDDPRWFMKLYKTSFINYLNDLSNKRTREGLEICEADLYSDNEEGTSNVFLNAEGEKDNSGYQYVLAEQMPSDVRSAVSILLNCREEIWNYACKGDNASNSLLCSWIGIDAKKVNIIAKTKDFFS